jgi:predicted nuclease of predicted toxin-antitoxin system
MKVLVDEMYEGFVKDLQKEDGFEVESVKQLINQGKKLHSDFSVLKYAKEKEMILVTADIENQNGCEENEIKYVRINKETVLKSILEGLKAFKV